MSQAFSGSGPSSAETLVPPRCYQRATVTPHPVLVQEQASHENDQQEERKMKETKKAKQDKKLNEPANQIPNMWRDIML